jgi:hypothetical protein
MAALPEGKMGPKGVAESEDHTRLGQAELQALRSRYSMIQGREQEELGKKKMEMTRMWWQVQGL